MASQAPVAPFLVSATFSPTLAMIAGISSLETQPHSPSRRGILFVCSDLLFANVPLTDGFPTGSNRSLRRAGNDLSGRSGKIKRMESAEKSR